jgi:hypothetical protein
MLALKDFLGTLVKLMMTIHLQHLPDPVGCVGEGEDAWEKFDGPLNGLLQKPPNELRNLVRVGEKGLIGLCRFLEYLVTHHQITGYLFEGKLEQLMLGIDDVYVNQIGE